MKRKNFRSKLALIAAAALTMSLGTGFTASADSYRAVAVPDFSGTNSYVYVGDPYTGSKNPVSYYAPAAPQSTDASVVSDKADAKAAELSINSTNFPDPKFLVYVADNFDTDKSGTLSDEEIGKVSFVNVFGLGISTLKGIEHFPNLSSLTCGSNIITSIDLSSNTALTVLDCSDNKLSSLNVRNNPELTQLNFSHNNITSIDLSNNRALKYLAFSCTNITSIDLSNNKSLLTLSCTDNKLTSLNVSNHTALERLLCANNSLTSLNVSGCTSLTQIICQNNKLESLDISSNTALEQLWCSYNYFSGKSDIVGLDEESLTDCDYKTQCYEGYVSYPGNAMINNIDTLNFTKVITGRITSLSINYKTPNDAGYDSSAGGAKVVGKPENVVTSDGIVFVPSNGYEIVWRSGGSNAMFNVTNTSSGVPFVTAYDPGVYTLSLTIKNYDGEGGDFNKSFEITAVNIEDHTVHEFPTKYNFIYTTTDNDGLLTDERHAKQCFCGERTDEQPHSYDSKLKITPYLDGTNMYFKYCPVCNYQKLIGGGNSNAKTLTDSKTQVSATILEGTVVPENAQLFVTDVTGTETVDIKGKSAVYDISLKSGGVEVQPESGKIAVTIPVPENVNGARAKVYRKEADGTFTDMNAVYNPQSKTLSFVTDHLSIYAVAGGDVLLGDVNGDGKINNTDIILLGRAYMAGNGSDYLDVADMNSDGKITNTDIILLGRLYMSQTV
ncbi:MAG: hypothetical protein HDT21_11545 [Ruminococcus sp.]|nr:hypothetical protein [Ruminococcus sp.]